MSSNDATPRRSYGTGSLIELDGRWVGKWRVAGRQVKRSLGPVRDPTGGGLTRKQAEAALRTAMADTSVVASSAVTVEQAGRALHAHLTAMGRKKATLQAHESITRVHLVPFFGARPLDRIGRRDVERFIAACQAGGCSPKSTLNYLGVLHSVFDFAMRREWITANPCKLVDKPRAHRSDDVHYLTPVEVEKLLSGVPDDDLGAVEKPMYAMAAMTGLRQGELLALRWSDVDWTASRVRVRRSFGRGEFTAPKSKRSSRSVPLADAVAVVLDELSKTTAYGADADLVFCHPHTGKPIDRSRLLKRFKAALTRAQVGEFEEIECADGKTVMRAVTRFHDLRHTFGTAMAGAGVPMRTVQEWMGHRDFATTLIYADYAPGVREAEWVAAAFGTGTNRGTNLGSTPTNSDQLDPCQ